MGGLSLKGCGVTGWRHELERKSNIIDREGWRNGMVLRGHLTK